jgi:hypothetical protein
MIDTKKIMREIYENRDKLRDCNKPHDFSIDLNPERKLGKRWKCSKCGGEIDAIGKMWYERGLEDGKIGLH